VSELPVHPAGHQSYLLAKGLVENEKLDICETFFEATMMKQ